MSVAVTPCHVLPPLLPLNSGTHGGAEFSGIFSRPVVRSQSGALNASAETFSAVRPGADAPPVPRPAPVPPARVADEPAEPEPPPEVASAAVPASVVEVVDSLVT